MYRDDVVVNGLGLQGFPAIEIEHPLKDTFAVDLRFGDRKPQRIWLTDADAKAAVKLMKTTGAYYKPIFDRVQTALANLEGDR